MKIELEKVEVKATRKLPDDIVLEEDAEPEFMHGIEMEYEISADMYVNQTLYSLKHDGLSDENIQAVKPFIERMWRAELKLKYLKHEIINSFNYWLDIDNTNKER